MFILLSKTMKAIIYESGYDDYKMKKKISLNI